MVRLQMLFLAILLIVGYTAIVNYSCDSADNQLAWFLVLIPAILGMLIWRK